MKPLARRLDSILAGDYYDESTIDEAIELADCKEIRICLTMYKKGVSSVQMIHTINLFICRIDCGELGNKERLDADGMIC